MGIAKYERWLEPEGLTLIENWARDGLTDEQIAHNMGVSVATLYNWKSKFLEILEALKKGKDVVDAQVESALYRKAIGFRETIKKPIKTKKTVYNMAGKKMKESEEIIYVDEEIFIPPDTTAQIFWLKNRRPDQWRDKQNLEVSGSLVTETSKLNELVRQMNEDG